MDNLFERPEKKEFGELNLVPVIDMFTTVIFFLLLSTVFIAYNKLTVPPSKVSTISDPVTPPPLAAMMILGADAGKNGEHLLLSWAGKTPGQAKQSVTQADLQASKTALIDASKKLAQEFHDKYPDERTIRLGMERGLPYQDLISVMDGVRDLLPDVVLISYDEAEARFAGSGGANP